MAYINTEGQWLANKVIQGLIASPIEMLVEVSIADIVSATSAVLIQFYAHERGFYIGVYAFTLFGSNYFAPMVSGVSVGKWRPFTTVYQ